MANSGPRYRLTCDAVESRVSCASFAGRWCVSRSLRRQSCCGCGEVAHTWASAVCIWLALGGMQLWRRARRVHQSPLISEPSVESALEATAGDRRRDHGIGRYFGGEAG
ncbi:uncharacterized protein BDR25DRAFT_85062 [Lindgomyces ingoldianus]|uniref:Uncharacterized protein n=1 Tax=Lindgomyces ingoldianus TaxID=673940 RepID=A0ACB6QGS2_9PLEO|nr:uncharacterized protein BDR25DRAFT_85062 [Lindgomyces ingoldianus]KAF2465567.1 hypothetical protein BDR25DRAFT_85062 [Lindgomyces ingoldianus]